MGSLVMTTSRPIRRISRRILNRGWVEVYTWWTSVRKWCRRNGTFCNSLLRSVPCRRLRIKRRSRHIRRSGPLRVMKMGKGIRRDVHVVFVRTRRSGLNHGDGCALRDIIRYGRRRGRLVISESRLPWSIFLLCLHW